MMWRSVLVFISSMVLVFQLSIPVGAGGNDHFVVTPDGPYPTIEAALAEASAGATIEVHSGVYPAPLTISLPGVSLIGVDAPVIDAGGDGSIVLINAPDVTVSGFVVRNSGRTLNSEDTGIVIQAPRALVEHNILQDVLFGIYFANASGGIARNNTINGYTELDMPLRGDGIRVWFSNNVILSGNMVTGSRDALIWFAEDIIIEGNTFTGNRYGLHFMYSSGAQIENNTFENNSIGAYLMYSDGLVMRNNVIAYNRGPSGHGLALKDMDDVIAADNLFVGNRNGLFLDNSPFSFDVFNHFESNTFAYNDVGVVGLPATQRNVFQGNSFMENLQQSGTHGRGTLQGNVWHQDGQGNYWSDYAGYDGDGDGIGDVPYRAEELFESLADANPVLNIFVFSPASQAIDFAAAAFPSLRPQPRLVDDAPLIHYIPPAQFAEANTQVDALFLLTSLVMIIGGMIVILLPRTRQRVPSTHQSLHRIGN